MTKSEVAKEEKRRAS